MRGYSRWFRGLRHLVGAVFLISIGMGTGWAEVKTWTVGGGRLSWPSQEEMSVAIDRSNTRVIQPDKFSLGENISGAVVWTDGKPKDLTVEGGARIWDNTALQASNLMVVDGDSTTSTGDRFKKFGVDQTGVSFFFDFGASYPMERIVFYTSPAGKKDHPRGYEIFVNDGMNFSDRGEPIFGEAELLRREQLNTLPRVDITFPAQLVRFMKLRILSPNPFEIAELEAYGEGFVPRAHYRSKFIVFDSPVNLGNLSVQVTQLVRGEEKVGGSSVALEVRNGEDDTPLSYHRRNPETGSEEVISKEDYDALPVNEKGSIRDDAEHWSPWSTPFVMDSTGTFTLPLDFLPSPRQYFQFRLSLEGLATEAMRVNRLSVQYSDPLATGVVGAVRLLGEETPEKGAATAPVGVDTSFIYDIRARFDSEAFVGFDGVRIATPDTVGSVRLEMGDPLARVEPDSIRVEDAYVEVYFPSHRVTPGDNRPIRVTFRAAPLTYTTTFNGWVLDTGGNLPQPILPEIYRALLVFGSSTDPSVSLRISPRIITPTHNEVVISYVLTQFAAPVQVEVEIYDLTGCRVKRLSSRRLNPGRYEEMWRGKDEEGEMLPPGTYLCRVAVSTDVNTLEEVRTITIVY